MNHPQRIVIGMIDGLGIDYYQASDMPRLKALADEGMYRTVKAVMPSVTNANNVSICCGAWPSEHGITGNSYLDEQTLEPEYMEDASHLCEPTVIQRARQHGVKSALLTSKKKTVRLLAPDAEIALAAEEPPQEYVDRFGPAPDIYSREINYWLWEVAIDILRTRPDIGLIYVHTTDYPMHMWPPEAEESLDHQVRLDALIGEATDAAPDAAMLFTADHGMDYKARCWDLFRACENRGHPLRFSLSPERDRYVKHHRTFGGCAWIWLNNPEDAEAVSALIQGLEGVQEVLTRREAAQRFNLMPERIGELMVLGDPDTVFGELPEGEMEELPGHFRTHGSTHELEVPLIVHNFAGAIPDPESFTANLHLTRHLVVPLWSTKAASQANEARA